MVSTCKFTLLLLKTYPTMNCDKSSIKIVILTFFILKLPTLVSQSINLAYLRNFRFSIPIFHESHSNQLLQGWFVTNSVSNRFYPLLKSILNKFLYLAL